MRDPVSDAADGPPPPPPEPGPARPARPSRLPEADAPRRPLKWILVGCGGAIAAFMIVIVAIVVVVLKSTEGPVNEVRAFLGKTAAGDIAGARSHLSAALRREIDERALRAMVEETPGLFRATDISFPGRKVELDRAILRGSAKAANGTTTSCEFQLVREGGGWKIGFIRTP